MNKSIFFKKKLKKSTDPKPLSRGFSKGKHVLFYVSILYLYLYCVHICTAVYISPVVQQSLHKPCDRGYEGYPALSPRLSLDLLQQTDKTKQAQQRTSQTAVHHMTHHALHTHTDSHTAVQQNTDY